MGKSKETNSGRLEWPINSYSKKVGKKTNKGG